MSSVVGGNRAGVYEYDAAYRQKRRIAQLCMALEIRELIEERPMSYGVAGKLIRDMCCRVRMKREGNGREAEES